MTTISADTGVVDTMPLRDRQTVVVGALMAAVGFFGVYAALGAAYFGARPFNEPWPPAGAESDTYLGVALLFAFLMPSLLIEWAVWAARTNHRAQSTAAHGMVIFSQLLALNTGWYVAANYGFGPGDGAYGTVVWALTLTVAISIGASVLGTLASLGRVVSGTTNHRNFDLVRANAWVVHVVLTGSLVAYWLVWYVK